MPILNDIILLTEHNVFVKLCVEVYSTIYAPKSLDGKRVPRLDIYYNDVGIHHELTPEEMEEAFFSST